MLKQSSIPNQYYYGDMPGTIQYKKTLNEIINIEVPENNEDCGYKICEHSLENLYRITPITRKNINWKIILMMRLERDEEIWIKGALQNKETGDIALLTTTNAKDNILLRQNRAISTIDGRWYVGQYRMVAPCCFWKELKNRLMY
jgi:hypothetical protein